MRSVSSRVISIAQKKKSITTLVASLMIKQSSPKTQANVGFALKLKRSKLAGGRLVIVNVYVNCGKTKM